jgi:hypothetical protein
MATNLLTMQPQRSAAVRIRAARCASSPTSLDSEHNLSSGVEVENDAVIVSGDDSIEGTFGYPAKTLLAVAQVETTWSRAIATQSAPPSRDVSTSSRCQQFPRHNH